MAAHKQRNGTLMVSYACKQNEHGTTCDEFVAELGDVVVCHCDCHEPCQRPACLAPRQQRRTPRKTCPVHFVQLPLTGVCDQCD